MGILGLKSLDGAIVFLGGVVHGFGIVLSGDQQSGADHVLLSGNESGYELLSAENTPAPWVRLTQVYAEVIEAAAQSGFRASQVYAEVLRLPSASIRVTQQYAEIIETASGGSIRVTQQYVEVIRSS